MKLYNKTLFQCSYFRIWLHGISMWHYLPREYFTYISLGYLKITVMNRVRK